MTLDRILYGDNQFFGINHASEEKARQQQLQFQDINAIASTLHAAYLSGIRGFSCTTHERIIELLAVIRQEPAKWDGLRFYPGMPYAHKYANAVTEHGYFDALKMLLPNGGLFDTMLRGGKALVSQDVAAIATLLIDAEMKPFEGLDTPVIFLQNIVTDLILGLGYYDAFKIFADHVEKKYHAEAGFFSMNLPMLLPALAEVGIANPIICANVNKAGFRMSGGVDAYRRVTEMHAARIIAMSVFASGAIAPQEAIKWVVDQPYVASILFGASSPRNIQMTTKIITELYDRPVRDPAAD